MSRNKQGKREKGLSGRGNARCCEDTEVKERCGRDPQRFG